MEYKKEVGNRLHEFRLSLKISQKEITEKLSITPVTWSSYEKGNTLPSLHVLKELHDLYGLDLNWLIANKENSEKPFKYVGEALEALFKMPIPSIHKTEVTPTDGEIMDNLEAGFPKEEAIKKYEIQTFNFSSHELNELLIQWVDMNQKYKDGIIDKELFDLWKSKKISDYKDSYLYWKDDPQYKTIE